ncbi:hypothetical protein K7711_43410 [Nocardia sp. CA2R105]|uniref:hypothetical protein n=1 Tax=Nocardia coffeae TaxID=2873381 RepID=UPI001CA6A5A9|nr:hypothetical protein [Nocardia coffeae]MBY8863379.1 hypothetical protein [Nocardia coffeae]
MPISSTRMDLPGFAGTDRLLASATKKNKRPNNEKERVAMSHPNFSSFQQLLDWIPDQVEYFYNETISPHFGRSGGAKAAALIPPAYSNWRDEQRAWNETTALFHMSHHMPELFLEGPDALKVLGRVGVNTMDSFTADRAKQFVVCSPTGHMIGDCILYRHGPESFELVSGMPALNWVHFHAETGGYDVKVTRDYHSTENPTGRRTRFRFQLDGPTAGDVFLDALDGTPPDLKFFRTAQVKIAGVDVLVLRHGMGGNHGVELSGEFDDEATVRAALLEAGKPHGIVPVGTTAYFSTPLSNAWMAYPVPGIYNDERARDYREWLPADTWEAKIQLGGSFYAPEIESYYVTPYDLGYERIVNFNHDFIGREALQAVEPEQRRHRRTLLWNRDDVARVLDSQLGDGPRYKALEFPVANYAWNHFDIVSDTSGAAVGLSCHSGYLSYEGQALSLALLDAQHAEPGTEVTITWGEPNGGSRKPQVERHEQTQIRATVAPAPYSAQVRNLLRADVSRR